MLWLWFSCIAKENLRKCTPSMAPIVFNERGHLLDMSNTGILPPSMEKKENSCLEKLNQCEKSQERHLHDV